MTDRIRPAVAGAAAIALYVIASLVSFEAGLVPVRPLYDGGAPPAAYRWVDPPSDLADDNIPPERVSSSVPLARGGSEAASVQTPDFQAHVVFPERVFPAREGQREVSVTIEPLDPRTVGEPPSGKGYEGNAYRISAVYVPSGEPATIAASTCTVSPGQVSPCPTLIMRYPFRADSLFVRAGDGWRRVESIPSPSDLSIVSEITGFGVFVAAGKGPPSAVRNVILFAAGGIAVVGAVILARWRGKPRTSKRSRKRARKK